jgi:phospholipid/cholesterol/gamma-HCH transport system permease protein
MSDLTSSPPPRTDQSPRPDRFGDASHVVASSLPSGVRNLLTALGEVGQLTVKLAKAACSNPREYLPELRDELFAMLRFCWLPVMVCVGGFCFLIGNYAYSLLVLVGAQNRIGTYFVFASAREISPFCTGMAMAGCMGTALTADLGARKVREELDALKVLGVDAVRTLVLPRVLSITFLMVAFNIVGVVLGVAMAAIASTALGTTSSAAYFSIFLSNMTTPEMIGTTIKTLIIGLFIGIVCASKGLTVSGGSEGVGRAVNQAVVLCFAATWIFNFVINAVMLGLNPEMIINR